jgi:hypothetical protein
VSERVGTHVAPGASVGVALLWGCVGLFLARVIGQIEVLLVAPAWLPAMSAWYSGLMPYHLLLPCQILILMLMSVMAFGSSRGPLSRRWSALVRLCRLFACVYFVAMVVRLALVVWRFGAQFLVHGAIPVAFHWILALFLFAWARLNWPPQSGSAGKLIRRGRAQGGIWRGSI